MNNFLKISVGKTGSRLKADKIATLKRAFFVEPLGGGWWSEPPGG